MVKSLGIEVPPLPPPNARDRLSSTGGSRGEECQSKSACQLEFLRALNERDVGLGKRFSGIDDRLGNIEENLIELRRELDPVYRMLSNLESFRAHERTGNRNSTPIGRAALDISAGPVKLRGKAWTVAILSLLLAALLGTIAAGAYVLGEWGRPTATATSK